MYVRRFFDESAKHSALEMVQDIRAEFDEILDEIDWMDEKTRLRAKEKSSRIVTHIAYPSELLEDQKLVDLYEGLNPKPEFYYKNMLDLTVFGTDYSFKRLREIVNKTDWISHGKAAVVNAFYSPLENSIQFPAGILQGIFFNAERPKYLNYGAIGFVIGHEITHGFDDQGKQFDSDGNLVDWWETDTARKFKEKAQCIIYQYGNYTVPEIGLNVNGINTQGENIADNGGIKEAYRAFLKVEKRHGDEPLLPGLQEFNSKQMFWIAAGNTWCGTYRPEALKLRLLTARHSPAQFRVNGPLANMPEFSKDFGCKPKTKMNPEERCSVW
jgi:predicted metalloendopeptidase